MTSSLTPREKTDWLRLARAESVGAVTFAHLISRYGSAAQAMEALPSLARRGGRAGAPAVPSVAEAEAELRAGAALGARLIACCESDFPYALRMTDAPPPLIWIVGDAGLLGRKAVAIVGARAASGAGRRFARALASALGEGGYVIVSGMARGIDAAAHEGSLDRGSVAVLAGGLDDVYPPENAELHSALASRGCLVSERPPGHAARAADFPRRNRIISGLSLGVVVVEAELRSGSLITARLAGEQGREVFAVPGSPLDPRARGANDLIRQGATLVEGADDVLRVLDALPGLDEREPPSYPPPAPAADAPADDLHACLEGLLSPTPIPIDELARAASAPTSQVLAALMELALAGRVELMPGGVVAAV
jgi:DNA processing protein